MQCPLCKKHTLAAIELAPALSGAACSECSGVWISRSSYDAWRARPACDIAENPAPVQIAVSDTHKAKVCPQCGHLLLPYRVGHGLPFAIDYCGGCGGVWLDRNEWDAIKAKNLHGSLHQIVTSRWQADVRQAGLQEAIENAHRRHLGAVYEKAKEVRSWLRAQPQKALILAYLADKTLGED